jgi:hypothetical protein
MISKRIPLRLALLELTLRTCKRSYKESITSKGIVIFCRLLLVAGRPSFK